MLFNAFDNKFTALYKYVAEFRSISKLVLSVDPADSRPPTDPKVMVARAALKRLNLPVMQTLEQYLIDALANDYTGDRILDDIGRLSTLVILDPVSISMDDVVYTGYKIFAEQYPDRDIHELMRMYAALLRDNRDIWSNNDKIDGGYLEWTSGVNIQRNIDSKVLAKIFNVQNMLTQTQQDTDEYFRQDLIPPALPTQLQITSTTVFFKPTYRGRAAEAEDGLDIFNSARPTIFAPYIKYINDVGQVYTKVYKGTKTEDRPDINTTEIKTIDSNALDTLYISLWLGNPSKGDKVQTADKVDFYHLTYDLANNKLTVGSIDTKTDFDASNATPVLRAQAALPLLTFGDSYEDRVKGEFTLWNIGTMFYDKPFGFDETTLLDMILNDDVLNGYVYLEEHARPDALKRKKSLYLHYHTYLSNVNEATARVKDYISNYAALSAKINMHVTTENTLVYLDVPAVGGQAITVEPNTAYITVNITRSESRATAEEFFKIFTILMRYYILTIMSPDNTLYSWYHSIMGLALDNLAELSKAAQPVKGSSVGAGLRATVNPLPRNINGLLTAPDRVFIQRKSKSVNCKKARALTVDEAETYMGYGFQVLALRQPDDSTDLYACVDDPQHQFPGILPNNSLDEQEGGYRACCYKKDHINDTRSNFYRWAQGETVIKKSGTGGNRVIKGNKILPAGHTGEISTAPLTLLSQTGDTFVRRGMPRSPNSLLYCIEAALNISSYQANNTPSRLEAYIAGRRKLMASSVYPGALRQEMYDYSDAEITRLIADPEVFFDPALMGMAAMHFYKINLYVFEPAKSEQTYGNIELPRHRVFYSRPFIPGRTTVIVYKFMGSTTDDLSYPQCDLVINQVGLGAFPANTDVNRICHDALMATNQTFTWSVDTAVHKLQANKNLYYSFDYLQIFKEYAPVSQYIDSNGKLRAITFAAGGLQLTVSTIPQQPLNLPTSDRVARPSIAVVIDILGAPTGSTQNAVTGLIDGLWFVLADIKYGLYVPVMPSGPVDYVDIPLAGPISPIIGLMGRSEVKRMTQAKRTADIIQQILMYLYEQYKLFLNTTEGDPHTFIASMVYPDVDTVGLDTSAYYDMSLLPRRLPAGNMVEALAELEVTFPSLIKGGTIQMATRELYRNWRQFILRYHVIRDGLPGEPNEHLLNYYRYDFDFETYDNALVFIGMENFVNWKRSQAVNNDAARLIASRITVHMGVRVEPYIYEMTVGKAKKYYLVQNVQGSNRNESIRMALAVCKDWQDLKVNIGSNPAPVVGDTPIYMIYGLSASNFVVPVEDHTVTNDPTVAYENYFKVLYYGSPESNATKQSARFGAMLELL